MCGIVAYLGKKAVQPILVEGLKRLEYRGYDSAGVALLGGVDVDFITRSRPEEVRAYTRTILDACAPSGGFALGVGNWVADSIPIGNFLAMLDEGHKYSL